MLERELSEHFKDRKWTWNLAKGTDSPSEIDMLDALEEAARVLESEEVGTSLEVGRLIVIKTQNGHDVYALFGSYV